MSIFDKLDLKNLIEKAMDHIDMEQIASDVMKDLKVAPFDMYFVVHKHDGADDYEFIGMAYSIETARELKDTVAFAEILKLDMMKMVPLAKEMGFVETAL